VQYPDMALQFAHVIAREFQAEGYQQIEVRTVTVASLNGRDYQHIINPNTDLAKQPRSLAPAPWIVPLEDPLPLS
jgi:vitamin K-dependent gamma-carboxylase